MENNLCRQCGDSKDKSDWCKEPDCPQAFENRPKELRARIAELEAECARLREDVIGEIAAERLRQITKEKWSARHDDEHTDGSLALAAACYAAHASAMQRIMSDVSIEAYQQMEAPMREYGWPWARKWWKPKDPRRDLIRAAALIVAEIDRLDRAARREQT